MAEIGPEALWVPLSVTNPKSVGALNLLGIIALDCLAPFPELKPINGIDVAPITAIPGTGSAK